MRPIRLDFGAILLQAGERLEGNARFVATMSVGLGWRWFKRSFKCELSRSSVGGQVDAGSSSRQNEAATDR